MGCDGAAATGRGAGWACNCVNGVVVVVVGWVVVGVGAGVPVP